MYQDQINLLVAGALAYPPCCPDVIICKLYMSVKLDEAQGKLSSIVPKGQLSGSGPTCWWISHPLVMLLGNHQPKQRQHRKSPFIH